MPILPNVKDADNVTLRITNNGISYSDNYVQILYRTPKIYYIDPAVGPSFGGTLLEVHGENLFQLSSYNYILCDEYEDPTVYGPDVFIANVTPFIIHNTSFMEMYSPEIIIPTALGETQCKVENDNQ